VRAANRKPAILRDSPIGEPSGTVADSELPSSSACRCGAVPPTPKHLLPVPLAWALNAAPPNMDTGVVVD
jgi:hypothetical protein